MLCSSQQDRIDYMTFKYDVGSSLGVVSFLRYAMPTSYELKFHLCSYFVLSSGDEQSIV